MLRIIGIFSLVLLVHYPTLRKLEFKEIATFTLLFTLALGGAILLNQNVSLPLIEYLNNLYFSIISIGK
jgi:hypothetical protein